MLGATPAHACSCAALPGAEQHRYDADVVLTGQVVDRREAGGDATYTIHVDRVYRGSAKAWQEVVTASQSSPCGLSLTIGEPVLLLGWVAVTAELIVLGVVAVIVAELVVLVRTRRRRARAAVSPSPP